MGDWFKFPWTAGFLVFGSVLQILAAEPFDYHSVRGRQALGNAAGFYEGEMLEMKGASRVQGMKHYGSAWSGDAHLLWDGTVGQAMQTSFHVEETGQYRLTMRLTKAPDYGRFSLQLNGVELKKDIDLFAPKVELMPVLDLGTLSLQAGSQEIILQLTGANGRANKFKGKGYLLGLDYLKLDRLDPRPDPIEEPAPEIAATTQTSLAEMRPVLAEYCHRCHGGEKVKGKVNLKQLTGKDDFLANIELTRKVSEALELHEMPPDEEKQLSRVERAQLAGLFRGYLEEYLQSNPSLAPVVMRRMNRYEYSNAVRDLLQLKGDPYPLPEKPLRPARPYFNPATGRFPNAVVVGNRALGKNQIEQHILTGVVPFAIDLQSEHGFNNRGDELSLSPILLESFLKLGKSIVNSPEFDGYTRLSTSLFESSGELSVEQQRAVARKRLRPLLERAFRRPLDQKTEDRYVEFFSREYKRDGSFRETMKRVVAGILASPRFIYVTEQKHQAKAEESLTPYELATRLSFFLWSSIPDEELLDLARRGELQKRDVLAGQVRRMLEDPRSQALSENFARQWLRLDQLITAVPDFERFERYYSRIGCEQWKFGLQSMVEPLLLFESIMVEDRSIMLLVDCNYSYRSDEMESWYRDAVPFGNKANRNRFNTNMQTYKRRNLKSRREGGVITSAAVLTMTSSPLRTSPITRGAWVASVIFNRPPAPPPDVVPEIEKDDAVFEAKGLTLRQRLKQHQVNPNCVSCHDKIDPLGYALENYDAVGRWRDKYRSGLEIDASGELFGEVRFKDIIGLKQALLEKPEWFMRAFSEHLLSYALGRELELSDQPALERIARHVMADHGKFSTVVLQVALSYPFLHKTNQAEQ